ncbi:MAG TPA: DUF3142 domain-containing protein [Chthoniobacterales bacterium]|nr:DUF3142 domain-containing protein [Chthoniobacterales bacterium]
MTNTRWRQAAYILSAKGLLVFPRSFLSYKKLCRSKLQTFTFAAIVLASFNLLGCHRSPPTVSGPISQRGYLWQRAWNPPVMTAVREAGKRMDGVIVIGAEIVWNDSSPRTIQANIDWPTLKHAGKPIALALRVAPYPGPFSRDDSTAKYISHVATSLITDASAHGLNVSEFQLDFDCAQKKLSGYSLWVEAVRAVVHPTRFVITTLPAWLNEPAFVPLVRLTDGYVLQVHSVPVSTQGGQSFLLNADLARQWTKKAARLGIPFSVALPTYRCLAGYDNNGKLLGVAMDSVDLAWPPGARTLEFSTDSDAAAKLVNEWLSARPAELKELIWYRVPVATDQRNWRWPTLAAVMAGRKPSHKLRSIQRGNNPIDLSIKNVGEADKQNGVKLTVTWFGESLVALDALPGWTVANEEGHAIFTRTNGMPLELQPGAERSVGWLRFDKNVEASSTAEEFSTGQR